MGFLIYKKTDAGSSVRYEKVKSLRLAGREGLIAKHVKTLPDNETQSWKLSASKLLEAAGLDASSHAVLFDVTEKNATNVCLYELKRIHGSCQDMTTQLALDFSVLLDEEVGAGAEARAAKFEFTPSAKPKVLGEMLALSGGPGGGDWKWDAPAMQLGATVVQPSCSHCSCGHHS